MADTRSQTAPRMTLSLDGGAVVDLRAIEGLEMEADIVENDLGPASATKKHVSNVRWTPALATIGMGMGKQMADWLRNSLAKPGLTAAGSIVAADFNYKAQSEITFADAVLSSLGFPALDGSSKESGALLVSFTAGQVRFVPGDGRDTQGKKPQKTKAWLCSNYKVEIGTLPCSRVARIEPFTWRCAPAADTTGVFREPSRHPAKVTVPDLQLSISAADHDAWRTAARSWFVDGKHLEGDEMPGRITLLGPDLKTELAVISFTNMGFRRFQPMITATGEKVGRFSVILYAEGMSLEWKL